MSFGLYLLPSASLWDIRISGSFSVFGSFCLLGSVLRSIKNETETATVNCKIAKIMDLGLIILKPEHNNDTFKTELIDD